MKNFISFNVVGHTFVVSKGGPDHTALGSSHASDAKAVELLVGSVGNGHGGALGAIGALSDAAGAGVVQLLDNLPAIPAGLAGFARVAIGVVASVLIERHGMSEMIVADEIPTAPAVVPSEEPRKGLAADVAADGRLIRLPMCGGGSGCDFAQLLVEDGLAGGAAQTAAYGLEVVEIARTVVEETTGEVVGMWGLAMYAEAAVVAGRWCVWPAWTSWDVCSSSQLFRRSQSGGCVENLARLSQLPWLVVGVVALGGDAGGGDVGGRLRLWLHRAFHVRGLVGVLGVDGVGWGGTCCVVAVVVGCIDRRRERCCGGHRVDVDVDLSHGFDRGRKKRSVGEVDRRASTVEDNRRGQRLKIDDDDNVSPDLETDRKGCMGPTVRRAIQTTMRSGIVMCDWWVVWKMER